MKLIANEINKKIVLSELIMYTYKSGGKDYEI